MPKDDLIYVGHMLDTARLAAAKVAGISREAFDADKNLRLALAHLIQTLGEAVRQVSSTFREAHPQTPWAKIIGACVTVWFTITFTWTMTSSGASQALICPR